MTKCTGKTNSFITKTIHCDDDDRHDPCEGIAAIGGALEPLNDALKQKQQKNNYIFTPTSPNNYGLNSPASQDYQNHLKQNQQFNQQQYQRHTDSMQDFRIRQLEYGQ